MGQFNRELGPLYIAYGRALFQVGLSKQDNLLNTGAVPENVVESLAAETQDGKRRRIIDLDGVLFEDFESEEEEQASGSDDDAKEGSSEQIGENTEKKEVPIAGVEAEGDSEEEAMEPTDGDMQLAWEILDIARIIYADGASVEEDCKLALADVHADLGDVSMETENFKQAVGDFEKSIELKQSIGSKPGGYERDLASLYFRTSMALEYDNRSKEAITPLKNALKLLNIRLDALALGKDQDDKGKDKVDFDAGNEFVTDESTEISQLITEVEAKLSDLQTQITSGNQASFEAQLKNSVQTAAAGAAQDLSNLIRKRKPEQQ